MGTTPGRPVVIDGNNLLFAMRDHAPLPHIGRETLIQVLDRWARRTDHAVTVVFDGPPPREGVAKQMTAGRVNVRFAAPRSADDVIVQFVRQTKDKSVRVITGDSVIGHETRYQRLQHTDAIAFVAELFSGSESATASPPPTDDESRPSLAESSQDWLDYFGMPDDDQSDDDPIVRI